MNIPGRLQSFMRMSNLFNPEQQDYSSIPSELPVNQYQSPLYDESVNAEVEQPPSTLEAFRQSVLNPPQRTHMTYPKSTLNGLTAALQIAAEPSPLEKNRVYVDGNAYQKQQVYTDPKTGEKKYITNVHEPSFGSQVMRAMPAAISGAVDVANQPYSDAISDWELKNKGLKDAIGAESAMALAKQREAQAGYTGQRADIERDKLAIQRMTAEERVRASQLNTLTDAEKIALLQEGKVSIVDINNAEAMRRVEAQQAGATQRTSMQQTGATQRTGMQQAGANRRNAASIAGAMARTTEAGKQARETKATPGGSANVTSQLPTQQIKAYQLKANQAIQDHPEWSDYIDIDEDGMVQVTPPGENIFGYATGPDKATYDEIISYIRGGAAPIAPPAKPTAKPTAKTTAGSAVEMITPDGKSTRMVPANQVELAKSQGYKLKGSK